jgi:hypothetical protein
MAIYRYSDDPLLTWPLMTITTQLNDVGVGDLTTYEQASDNVTANTRPDLMLQNATAQFVAQIYLGTGHSLTAAAIKCALTRSLSITNPVCVYGLDEDAIVTPLDGGVWALSTWDGASYDPVDEGTLAWSSGGSLTQSFTINSSWTAVTSCWLRLTITFDTYHVFCEGSLGAAVLVSDFRYTGTDTGLTCTEGTGGGDGPDLDPPADDDDTTDCGCDDWQPAERVSATWASVATSCATWTLRPCHPATTAVSDWDFSMTSIVDFSQTTGVAFFDSTATG